MAEAFYAACIIFPMAVLGWLVVRLMFKGSSQVMLCMECEQCMGRCPLVARKGGEFPGPRGIMVAVKAGQLQKAIDAGALACTDCGLCEKACPRGLAPYRELEAQREKIRRQR